MIEIIAIGNELLNGSVQDTNTHWMCQKLSELGGQVRKVTLLPDDLETIGAEVAAALQRETEFILVAGGLGPTPDDLSLAAVARGAGVELALHPQARLMIKDSYDSLAKKGVIEQGGLNPAREKMAWLPRGAVPLENPVGTAPGVLLEQGKSRIICLPGVPGEMKAILEKTLDDFWIPVFTPGQHQVHQFTVACNDESLLEPYFKRFAEAFPGVYLKARSGIFEETPRLTLTFSWRNRAEDPCGLTLDQAAHALRSWLEADDIQTWDRNGD